MRSAMRGPVPIVNAAMVVASIALGGCAQLAGIEDWTPRDDTGAAADAGTGSDGALAVCTPGELSCDQKTLWVCNESLDGWKALEVCGANEICDVQGGHCDVCVAGSWQCNGAELQQCDAEGQSFTTLQTCEDATSCDAIQGTCAPTSCVYGDTGASADCGSTGDQDCCATALVDAGSFDRSNDESAPASVEPFRLDVYEVTVGRFRAFLLEGTATRTNPPIEGAGALPGVDGSGWQPAWDDHLAISRGALRLALVCDSEFATWTNLPAGREHLPIVCVTWYEAFAFCAWDGGRLATEAEWNYAAAGGSEQRLYPWGASIDADHASYHCLGDGSAAGVCAAGDILAVGAKPAGIGRWRHADLAGNAAEWVRDAFAPYVTPCQGCVTLEGSLNVVRGGSFDRAPAEVTTLVRDAVAPSTRSGKIGIRCARLH